ncbi:NAD(P)/FAD-dependent oxidoreductase [Micromonospora eburnea]|uniref:3-phenylpropionate/trans-cinnamate dioxygenase ferredoxin reductase subunit n=1 Tax=Micromonospora eburnea TaxID=227316 RepID=A0A1C6UXI7_9ACTN|nr:FAD-dependent oxidoreductase [Micromonospora eburnea]SCL58778.1 3-phenylpropionate/trans-cinnamate dioxygenase ferredoxin reductase subunit [Micromonospora eburnea]
MERIVVVGASLAGVRAVQALRTAGFTGELTLIGAERHSPYNRPPLSKSVLRGDDDVTLPGAAELDEKWLLGRAAMRLDTIARVVTVDDGSEVRYDGLVIATGARPRRLADHPAGVHTLRTLDDALALRAALSEGQRRIVVIGGGFVGGEVTSTARSLGHEVTLVDGAAHPMVTALGTQTAQWLGDLHRHNGVNLISGVRVTGFDGTARVTGVRLGDGRVIPADLVVAGMGVVPNTDWLDGSGLTVADGVVCESTLHARGAADIVAAGDVARWPHQLYGNTLVRVEHWANANDQGRVAALNLLAGPDDATPFADVPSFATNAHGARIQIAGLPHLAEESRLVTGAVEDHQFTVGFTRNGVLVGVVAVNSPRDFVRLKRGVAARSAGL